MAFFVSASAVGSAGASARRIEVVVQDRANAQVLAGIRVVLEVFKPAVQPLGLGSYVVVAEAATNDQGIARLRTDATGSLQVRAIACQSPFAAAITGVPVVFSNPREVSIFLDVDRSSCGGDTK
jgi:hypothetical protein